MSDAAGRRRAEARIDLGAVRDNCERLGSELDAGTQLCAVVKAAGYGHGAVRCAEAALEGGATYLAVAAAEEAMELRERFGRLPILVMGALSDREVDLAVGAGAELAAWREGFAEMVDRRAAARGTRARLHVKLDSGMGRLGERDPGRVIALADRIAAAEHLELAGAWTHFATADEPDPAFFEQQLDRFASLVEGLRSRHPGLIAHAANSAATLRDRRSHFDMVRCGIAVYGLDPFGTDPGSRRLRPALELRSYVADVKPFPAGTSAGYGRRWRAPRDTWVGVLPIGYGDGVRRGLSGNADVLVAGRRYPVVGTVSMDNVTIDLGPEAEVGPGEEAVLIGDQGPERILCEEVASRLDTINYEVACGISARVPRSYPGAGP